MTDPKVPSKAECNNAIIDIETLARLYDTRLLARATTIRARLEHLEPEPSNSMVESGDYTGDAGSSPASVQGVDVEATDD